jgi:sarcosine oxidase / L-pipecolate oxidase
MLRTTNDEWDVVVVGGGIIGSCTAYALAASGKSTLLLEQFSFLHRRGSSHGDSRIIRRTYPEDFYAHMMREAYAKWDNAEHEAGYKVVRTGEGAAASRQILSLYVTL